MKPLLLLIVASYTLMSLVTWAVYAHDKAAATRHDRRVPERNLHLLALCGGWPGAWLAQRMLRHKSSKSQFLWLFRLTVLLNLAGLFAAFWAVYHYVLF